MTTVYKGVSYDDRHGSPFDRGSADSYYGRERKPHYYEGGTGMTPIVTVERMTGEEVAAYHAGYDYNEEFSNKKNYS